MLGGDLPRAIADREFAVSFQPIVDLATGQMVSAEALARWRHPERGDLDPRRFLTAVERSGLLPAFAEAVLDQALAAMKRWRAAGHRRAGRGQRLAPQPARPDVRADGAWTAWPHHGVAGSDLVIELTETLTLTQVDLVGGVLRRAARGRGPAGPGRLRHPSSSLAMLAKVPFFELKIDRGFVSGDGPLARRRWPWSGPPWSWVARCTATWSPRASSTTSSGALWEMGCPAGQGHLFARPMPIDALMRAHQTGVDGVVGRLYPPMHAAGQRDRPAPDARPALGPPLAPPGRGQVGRARPRPPGGRLDAGAERLGSTGLNGVGDRCRRATRAECSGSQG